jgi:hypothetical protein
MRSRGNERYPCLDDPGITRNEDWLHTRQRCVGRYAPE